METPPRSPTGFIAALHTLGESLIASVQDRVELFSVELQEERVRLVQTFLWISAAVCTGMLAISFASLAVVVLFWQDARFGVLVGLAAFYAAALLLIVLAFRRHLSRLPKPFAATLEEFGADRACIRPKN